MAHFNFSHIPSLPNPGSNLNTGFKAINAFQNYLKNCDKVKWLEMERSSRMVLLKDFQVLHARSTLLEEIWAETLTNEIGNLFNLLKSWMPVYDPGENVSKRDEAALEKLKLAQRECATREKAVVLDCDTPKSPGTGDTQRPISITTRDCLPSNTPIILASSNQNQIHTFGGAQFPAWSILSTKAAPVTEDDNAMDIDDAHAHVIPATIPNFGAGSTMAHNPLCHRSIADKDTQGDHPSPYLNVSATDRISSAAPEVESSSQPDPNNQQSLETTKSRTGLLDSISDAAGPGHETTPLISASSREDDLVGNSPSDFAKPTSTSQATSSETQKSRKRKLSNALKQEPAKKRAASKLRATPTPATPTSEEIENDPETEDKSTNRKSSRRKTGKK